jgi:hypothetical protein
VQHKVRPAALARPLLRFDLQYDEAQGRSCRCYSPGSALGCCSIAHVLAPAGKLCHNSSSSCRGTTSDHPTGAACLTMTETISSSHKRFHITALTTACLPMTMATGVLPRTEQRCSSTAAEQQLSCHSIHISRLQVMTVDDG